MSLSSVESRLPPGFRFHPKDEELICDYLVKWVAGFPHSFPSLINVDLNKCEPWDIPEIACVGGKEWYFYSQRDRKYATGLRTNRATLSGYWKATGKDRPISRKGTLMGMRKTLVFYQGRAPKGHKTDWVMHEFRLHEPDPAASQQPVKEEDWVLCRVFFKNRREIPSKQGASATSPAPGTPPYSFQLLPGLMDQACMAPAISDEQVSCFSIFNQTNPNLLDPPLSQMLLHPGPSKIFSSPNPSSSGTNFADLGIHSYVINPMMMHDIGAASNSSCNNNSSNNNNAIMKGSPVSFGEAGSSDSYLSEVGLSSMWINPYHS